MNVVSMTVQLNQKLAAQAPNAQKKNVRHVVKTVNAQPIWTVAKMELAAKKPMQHMKVKTKQKQESLHHVAKT
jgi:hypothetical protein